MQNGDIPGAKKAALELKKWVEDYIRKYIGHPGKWDGRAFRDAINNCDQFIEEVQPVGNNRCSPGGSFLDFHAPSIWHAACLVLSTWVKSRCSAETYKGNADADKLFFGIRMVIRGQAYAWPIVPSLWRPQHIGIRGLGDEALRAFHQFIEDRVQKSNDIRLDMLNTLRGEAGVKSIAQHYGFPTNLVDFTFDPLVALHFALGRTEQVEPIKDVRDSCGALFSTSYYRLAAMGHLFAKHHFVHFPPIEARRLYLQSGFFSDFGVMPKGFEAVGIDEFTDDWRLIEKNCTRLFFPRSYPDIDEGHELLKGDIEPEEKFFSTAIARLKSYADSSGAAFDQANAILAMTSGEVIKSPWRNAGDSDIWMSEDFDAVGLNVVRYLCMSALVHTASADSRIMETHFDPALIYRFAKFSPEALRVLDEIGQMNGPASTLCRTASQLVGEAHEVAVDIIKKQKHAGA